jgi:DNA invertase Pin-like site-specific DNA recombinase
MLPCVTKKQRRVVGYIRVSTAKQGASGLGLEAQKPAIAAHAACGACVVLETYEEVRQHAKVQEMLPQSGRR